MEKKTYIDLHTHTMYSDGISSPKELVAGAKLKGTDILAVTDHDTIAGYEEAKKEAGEWGIVLVSGAEFTTKKYHILGLNFDTQNKNITDFLEYSKSLQRQTCQNRVRILENYGMPIDMQKIEHYFPMSRLGKNNILMAMLKDKECREWVKQRHDGICAEGLMKFYLKKEGIAGSVEKPVVEPRGVINAVHGAGGIAILAHPPLDVSNLLEINYLKALGLDGIEIQPNFYEKGYKQYEEYAMKNSMLITYGSDYHGPNFYRPLLGRCQNIASPKLEEILLKAGENNAETKAPESKTIEFIAA